jgi:RNA polymerase sigma-70 factor (ECF subfamily)
MNTTLAARDVNDTGRRTPALRGPEDDRKIRWAALVDRIAHGDSEAIGALYDESSHLMFGLILHILQDRAAAEDALVDVYLQLREQARFNAHQHDAVSWLIGLARRTALARLRRNGRSPGTAPWPSLPSVPATSVLSFEPSHRERLRVSRALDQLTPQQRALIQMMYFGGLSAREASDESGLPPELVSREVQRAMQLLRNFLTCED